MKTRTVRCRTPYPKTAAGLLQHLRAAGLKVTMWDPGVVAVTGYGNLRAEHDAHLPEIRRYAYEIEGILIAEEEARWN